MKKQTFYAEQRKQQATERYCPAYHFISPNAASNDPNGLCCWQGKWHLFYQHSYPEKPAAVHWGHTVSEDLIHWKDLPDAIIPGPEKGCWSGTTLVDDGKVIAMYYGLDLGCMVAVANDRDLMNWEKLTGTAVIPEPTFIFTPTTGKESVNGKKLPPDAVNPVFDPCIWKQGDFYYALTGGSMLNNPANRPQRTPFLYRSSDLKEWEFMHDFLENDIFGRPGDDCACPYFWPIGNRHILIHFSHKGGSHYMLGDYDTARNKFIVRSGGSFGFGPTVPGGLLAPSATPDGNGGLIVLFNVTFGTKASKEWNNQVFSLPRRLTLAGDELRMTPVDAVKSLRKNHIETAGVKLTANQEVQLDGFSGNCVELIAEIEAGNSQLIELNVLRSPDKEEFTTIRFYKDRGFRDLQRPRPEHDYFSPPPSCVLSIDSNYSSVNPEVLLRTPETTGFILSPDEKLKLHIFIDKSIIEVFANDKICLTQRVYPNRADSTGISICSRNGSAELLKFDLWEMARIY